MTWFNTEPCPVSDFCKNKIECAMKDFEHIYSHYAYESDNSREYNAERCWRSNMETYLNLKQHVSTI